MSEDSSSCTNSTANTNEAFSGVIDSDEKGLGSEKNPTVFAETATTATIADTSVDNAPAAGASSISARKKAVLTPEELRNKALIDLALQARNETEKLEMMRTQLLALIRIACLYVIIVTGNTLSKLDGIILFQFEHSSLLLSFIIGLSLFLSKTDFSFARMCKQSLRLFGGLQLALWAASILSSRNALAQFQTVANVLVALTGVNPAPELSYSYSNSGSSNSGSGGKSIYDPIHDVPLGISALFFAYVSEKMVNKYVNDSKEIAELTMEPLKKKQ